MTLKLNVPSKLASTAIQVRQPSYTVAPQSNITSIVAIARQVPATVKRKSVQTYDLSEIWRSNQLVAEEPPSNITQVQNTIVEMYAGLGIDITADDVNYFDDNIGFFFNTGFNMHSDAGSNANQIVKRELPKITGKNVTVGGSAHRVRVWIDK